MFLRYTLALGMICFVCNSKVVPIEPGYENCCIARSKFYPMNETLTNQKINPWEASIGGGQWLAVMAYHLEVNSPIPATSKPFAEESTILKLVRCLHSRKKDKGKKCSLSCVALASILSIVFGKNIFLEYLAVDVKANCICEIHCFALDELDLNTVLKLSSKEKKSC